MADTTVGDIRALVNISQCLDDIKIKTTKDNAHSMLAWLVIKILQKELYRGNLSLCKGTLFGKAHSWLTVKNDGEVTIVDMAADQSESVDTAYIGSESDNYIQNGRIGLFNSDDAIMEFLASIKPKL